ncbi:hypothetical protein JXM67_07595 [candidate division WOR-3 bacterium]|nr:hypothetical protein [candidate division WOR-3 bacterium]
MRKIILATAAVVLLIAATPLSAQLAGAWAGEGEGVCSPPPFWTSDFPIYAWQNWKGEISEDENAFFGEWYDMNGRHGRFKGEAFIASPTEVVFKGVWTWIYDACDPPKEYEMGTFWMKFHKVKLTCYGEWVQKYSGEDGTMKGKKVK